MKSAIQLLLKSARVLLVITLLHGSLLPLTATTHTWTGAAGDGRWSTSANWSGGAPAVGESGSIIVKFPVSGTKRSTNDLPGLTLDQIHISGHGYIIAARANAADVSLRSQLLGPTMLVTGEDAVLTGFVFNNSASVAGRVVATVGSGASLVLSSRLIGDGGLEKLGDGTLKLAGTSGNTYAGATTVGGGILELAQTGQAVPGDVVIGHPSLAATGILHCSAPNQIGDTAAVTVNANGVYEPWLFQDIIGELILTDATVAAGPGLTINGNIIAHGKSLIQGTIRFGTVREVRVEDTLTMDCFVGDSIAAGGLRKLGLGTLELLRSNTFTGGLEIEEGTVKIGHGGALGGAGPTIVHYDTSLVVNDGVMVGAEPITLSGFGFESGISGALIMGSNTALGGTITLDWNTHINVPVDGGRATLSGTVQGPHLITKNGSGTLRFAGPTPNSFAGLGVDDGIVELAKSPGIAAVANYLSVGFGADLPPDHKVLCLQNNQFAPGTHVSVDASGLLDLNGTSQSVGPLAMRCGRIETGAGGLLNLTDDVTAVRPSTIPPERGSVIEGLITLNHPERVFDVAGDTVLHLEARVRSGLGAGGMHKIGAGGLFLYGVMNDYSGVTRVSAGRLNLSSDAKPGNTSGSTIIEYPGSLILTACHIAGETLSIPPTPEGNSINVQTFQTVTWSGPVQMAGDLTIVGLDTPGWYIVTFDGPISGTGNLSLRDGDFRLAGPSDNTLNGATRVLNSSLELAKQNGFAAVSGSLIVGESTGSMKTAVARFAADHQIADHAGVIVHRSGTLDLANYSDGIGGLEIHSSKVETGTGTLTLLGDLVIGDSVPGAAGTLTGHLSLGGATRTILGTDDGYLNLNADISDGGSSAGIHFIGGTLVYLRKKSSFSGPVTISGSNVQILDSEALGQPSGGATVEPGGRLGLGAGVEVGNETLWLAGAGPSPLAPGALETSAESAWNGPIVLTGDATIHVNNSGMNPGRLTLTGSMSGSGHLTKSGPGSLVFDGTAQNSYLGSTYVTDGLVQLRRPSMIVVPGNLFIGDGDPSGQPRVELYGPSQIAQSSIIEIAANGSLDLNDYILLFAGLNGSGQVECGLGAVYIESDSVTAAFDGAISGSGDHNFVKQGQGTQTLSGHNTYTGRTIANDGILYINGNQPTSNVEVNPAGELGGTGILGSLTVQSYGTVSPGTIDNPHGKLTVGSLNFAPNSWLHIDLDGTQPGVDHDQIAMSGLLIINEANLKVAGAFPGPLGSQCTLIDVISGGAAMGSFRQAGQDDTLDLGQGVAFQADYFGGDNNVDFVLTRVVMGAPATVSSIQPLASGFMQIVGTGLPEVIYDIYACQNLTLSLWEKIGSAVSDSTGQLKFTDENAKHYTMRFYQFVQP